MGRISTRFRVTRMTGQMTGPIAAAGLCLAGPGPALASEALAADPKAPAPVQTPAAAPTAKPGAVNEIQVTLFGQPCLMNGPLPKETLTLLHEVSPERVPPEATVEQMKKIREKLAKLQGVPLPLEQYREHLRKRLSAKIAIEEALGRNRASRKGLKGAESRKAFDTLMKNLKEHVSTVAFPAFEAQQRKSLEASGWLWSDGFVDGLREKYEEVIQPETQEEFHKAIRLAKIQYVCSFDESDGSSREENEE